MWRWLTRKHAASSAPQVLADLMTRPLGKLIETLIKPDEPAPGGRRRGDSDAVVDCAVYARGERLGGPERRTVPWAEAIRQTQFHRGAFVWLGLHEPDEATMRAVARAFGLHELTVEQALAADLRPAVEAIGDVTRVVLRTARYIEHDELTETSEVVDTGVVTLLIGRRFVITVRHGPGGALWRVRADLEKRSALLEAGPWAVGYAVCTAMVDAYLDVAEHVEDDLERVEETAFNPDHSPGIPQMYQLKREMVEFKRAVMPFQEPMNRLLDIADLPEVMRPYLVDVRGRLARAVDRVSGFDDLLNSILQARLAQVSVDQNNDMRKIASWAAIAAVQTTIVGIYGMNFLYMPELGWRYGYFGVLAVMVGAGVLLYRRLKKAGWL